MSGWVGVGDDLEIIIELWPHCSCCFSSNREGGMIGGFGKGGRDVKLKLQLSGAALGVSVCIGFVIIDLTAAPSIAILC